MDSEVKLTEPSAELLGAVARGWCAPENAHKVMDPELAIAIAREVAALARPSAAGDARDAALRAIAASRIEATGTPPVPDLTAEQAWRIARAALTGAQP